MGIKYPREVNSRGYSVPPASLNGVSQHRSHSDRSSPDGRILFKLSPQGPPLNDRSMCIKYFHHVENKLKKWCQSEPGDLIEKTLETWDLILPYMYITIIQKNLLTAASKIFEMDTQYYLSKELDTRVWKYGIYRFITILRSDDIPHGKVPKAAVKEIIKIGIHHYEELLKVGVPKVLNIQLEPIFSRNGLLRMSGSRLPSTAEEDMIYRVFIYMGDLYRYRYQIDRDHHGAKMAKSMYVGARFCDSGKSRAYYQLGLVAKTQGDFIGMIYNFTRAWHVSNPADGAFQQLQLIYGDVSQWYSKCKWSLWYTRVKVADNIYSREWDTRDDIWIVEIDSASIKQFLPNPVIPPGRSDHLKSLSEADVFTRFSLAFAHFLGMLYTNIGTEYLEHVSKEQLVYFEGLIMLKNFNKFYVLMEALGMLLFLIDHLAPPVRTRDNAPVIAQKIYLRCVAISTSLEMIMILMERIKKILTLYDWENPMLIPCSAAVHVWCNWAQRRQDVITELKRQLALLTGGFMDEDKGCGANFLLCYLQLSTVLTRIMEQSGSTLLPNLERGRTNTSTKALMMLPEQVALDGFANIMLNDDVRSHQYFYNKNFQQGMAQLGYRFDRILELNDIIFGDLQESDLNLTCGQRESNLIDWIFQRDFRIMNTIYKKKDAVKPGCSSQIEKRPDCNNARIIIISRVQQEHEMEDTSGEESPKLTGSMKKANLSDVHEIFSQLSMIGVRTEIVINPLRVVLDTNTFIRNLEWIQILIYLLPYPLIIPTTVLLELRGLAKGAKTGESPRYSQKLLTLEEHKLRTEEVMKVGEQCLQALEFLDQYKRYFKVITVEGKEVKMYKYKTQKVFDKRYDRSVRNDEKILETCLQLEEQDTSARAQDHPLRLYRNTVLVTGDRSLRVRAYAQDIPARDINSFTDWIKNL